MNRAFAFRIAWIVALLATAQGVSARMPAPGRGPTSTQSTAEIHVAPGWNLLSLPVSVSTTNWVILFPTAISQAYVFEPSANYRTVDTVQYGSGFWLKFDSAQTVMVQGTVIVKDTLAVHSGWNLIGTVSVPIAVDSISTDPPGILSSHFLRYSGGAEYVQADTLRPGVGYWLKASQNGSVVLAVHGPTCPGVPTVSYYGKIYNTVQIADQCWLREDLDAGIMVSGDSAQTDNGVIEKYCYDNNPSNCDTYGGLYQWREAMQYNPTEGGQGICPPGWHIPTSAEYQALQDAVGDDGNALKAVGQGTNGGAGTNTSGFSALLAGVRGGGGGFSSLGYSVHIWSSSEITGSYALYLNLVDNNNDIYLAYHSEDYGYTVRCLKD